jgi:hypothetical protein
MRKSAIGYKLFKVKKSHPGELFPLYVNADAPIPMNRWIEAECGEILPNGKVKAKLGNGLAVRPGFHINDGVPYVSHIGKKDENGNIAYLPDDLVWCEVEYPTYVDYQPKANFNGTNKNGKIVPVKACLKEIPVNGFYRFKTCAAMTGQWIIAGAIKINRILSDTEVSDLCATQGYTALPRYSGQFDATKYGFTSPECSKAM